jgi:hypothetical protein
MDVYVLHHVHEFDDDREDLKLIGVYATQSNAEAAVVRLSLQPGFREHPDGFHIGKYTLDTDHWLEGFVTV